MVLVRALMLRNDKIGGNPGGKNQRIYTCLPTFVKYLKTRERYIYNSSNLYLYILYLKNMHLLKFECMCKRLHRRVRFRIRRRLRHVYAPWDVGKLVCVGDGARRSTAISFPFLSPTFNLGERVTGAFRARVTSPLPLFPLSLVLYNRRLSITSPSANSLKPPRSFLYIKIKRLTLVR